MKKIIMVAIIGVGLVEAMECDYRSLNDRADAFCMRIVNNEDQISEQAVLDNLQFIGDVKSESVLKYGDSPTFEGLCAEADKNEDFRQNVRFGVFLESVRAAYRDVIGSLQSKIAVTMLLERVMGKLSAYIFEKKKATTALQKWRQVFSKTE